MKRAVATVAKWLVIAGWIVLPATVVCAQQDEQPAAPEPAVYERGTVAPQVKLPVSLEMLADREVDTDRVFLGVIAKCVGHASICKDMESIDLGAAPAPGRILSITKTAVSDIVKQEYENLDLAMTGRDVVQLRGASIDIDAETVQREFRQFVASRFAGRNDLRVRVERLTMSSAVRVRPGNYSLQFPGFAPKDGETLDQVIRRFSGLQTVEVRHTPEKETDQACQVFWANTTMVVERELPVARSNLQPRAVLTADDVEIMWVSVGRGTIAYADSVNAVVGKRLRGSVAVGQPVAASQMETPTAVKMGSQVRVFVKSGDLEVVGRAKAASSGAIGQMIDVVYPASQKRVSARITGNDTVEAVF